MVDLGKSSYTCHPTLQDNSRNDIELAGRYPSEYRIRTNYTEALTMAGMTTGEIEHGRRHRLTIRIGGALVSQVARVDDGAGRHASTIRNCTHPAGARLCRCTVQDLTAEGQ